MNLVGVYPIYDREREFFENIGLGPFWKYPDFDLHDVNRPEVEADQSVRFSARESHPDATDRLAPVVERGRRH